MFSKNMFFAEMYAKKMAFAENIFRCDRDRLIFLNYIKLRLSHI